jgi:hypothetical protein
VKEVYSGNGPVVKSEYVISAGIIWKTVILVFSIFSPAFVYK